MYEWNYTGNKHRTSCSKCKTSITLSGDEQVRQQIETVLNHKQVYMPIGMAVQLNKFMLARLIGIAKSNGDESIKFNLNNDGVLSLPQ